MFVPEALQTGHSQWSRLYPPREAIPRGPCPPTAHRHSEPSLKSLPQQNCVLPFLFSNHACASYIFEKPFTLRIVDTFFLNLQWGKMLKISRLHGCSTFWWGLGYRQITCSLGFSLPTGVLLTTIFRLPMKENSGETVVQARKAALAAGLYPCLVGNESQGKWRQAHGFWEIPEEAYWGRGEGKIKRISYMPNTATGISGSAERLNVSANITAAIDWEEENRTLCIWESETPIIIAGPFRPVQRLIS